jgi:hypothetical protein
MASFLILSLRHYWGACLVAQHGADADLQSAAGYHPALQSKRRLFDRLNKCARNKGFVVQILFEECLYFGGEFCFRLLVQFARC